MPVRVDDATESIKTNTTKTTPTTTHRRGDNRRSLITLLAVLVAVIIGVMLSSLIIRSTTPASTEPGVPGRPAESSSVATREPATRAPRFAGPLPRSEIVAGAGGISNVYELRTGYGKTTNDAVQAAMNFLIVDNGPAYYNQRHYEAIQASMYASPEIRRKIGYRQSAVDALRKRYQVDDRGRPLTDGQPDPNKKIWDAVYLQYGAYRIVESSSSEVRVMMWAPIVYGVDATNAATPSRLHIAWIYADKTVRWVDGDWRQSGNKSYPASETPQPADPAQVITSIAERADLLGTDKGWTLPANAAETDIPELQLPGK